MRCARRDGSVLRGDCCVVTCQSSSSSSYGCAPKTRGTATASQPVGALAARRARPEWVVGPRGPGSNIRQAVMPLPGRRFARGFPDLWVDTLYAPALRAAHSCLQAFRSRPTCTIPTSARITCVDPVSIRRARVLTVGKMVNTGNSFHRQVKLRVRNENDCALTVTISTRAALVLTVDFPLSGRQRYCRLRSSSGATSQEIPVRTRK